MPADVERVINDMRLRGAPETAIAKVRERLAPATVDPVFVVHADNVVAVKLMIALDTQWRTATPSTMTKALIIRTGLDYGVVETVARLERLEVGDGDFGRLRALERECLAAWAEERERA